MSCGQHTAGASKLCDMSDNKLLHCINCQQDRVPLDRIRILIGYTAGVIENNDVSA